MPTTPTPTAAATTTSRPRSRRDTATLAGVAVLLTAWGGWQATQWFQATLREEPDVTRIAVPTVADATPDPAAGWAIDVDRPSTLLVERRFGATESTILEVPIRSTKPDGTLPTQVSIGALLEHPTYGEACTMPKRHPGTVLYPEKVVTLDCLAVNPDDVKTARVR